MLPQINLTLRILLASTLFTSLAFADSKAKSPSPLVITKRSVVVFHESREEQKKPSVDDEEAGGDFVFYLDKMQEGFKAKHPEIDFVFSSNPKIKLGKGGQVFERKKSDASFGFIFFEPGKKPRIELGVITDTDAYCISEKYWAISFAGLCDQ